MSEVREVMKVAGYAAKGVGGVYGMAAGLQAASGPAIAATAIPLVGPLVGIAVMLGGAAVGIVVGAAAPGIAVGIGHHRS